MKTLKELKEEIKRIEALDVEGFDNSWVLKEFARGQALINIHLIKAYTDKYELIVRYLVTGKDATAAAAYADDAVYAASAGYAANAANAAFVAASDVDAVYVAAVTAANAATDTDYTKAIESLNALANEYLALLSQEAGEDA